MESLEKRIIGFHTGRGGKFYNAGFVECLGETDINNFTDNLFIQYENTDKLAKLVKGRKILIDLLNSDIELLGKKLKFDLGKLIYVDSQHNEVGLYVENNGTGTIDFDREFDTIRCKFLEELNENELEMIVVFEGYIDFEIFNYAKNKLNILKY